MSRDFSTIVEDYGSERPKTRAPGFHFDLKRFLNLRLLSVIAITAVLAGPLAVLGWFAAPDVYTASAVLQFRSVVDEIIDRGAAGGAVAYDKFVGTELAKLKGNIVLSRVLERPEVQRLASLEAQSDKLAYLESTISTSKSRNSELVTVYCTMKSRAEALVVLQCVMDEYQKLALNEESGSVTNKVATLNREIENRTRELDLQRERIRELEGALGSMAGLSPVESKEAEQYRDKFLDAEDRVTEMEDGLADAKKNLERVAILEKQYAENPDNPIYEFGIDPSMVQGDMRVSSSQTELSSLESRVALLSESHKPEHPALEAAQRQLDSVRANVERRERLARADALQTIRGRFELEVETLERNLKDEQETLELARERLKEFESSQEEKLEMASSERAHIQMLRERAEGNREFIAGLEAEVRNIQLNEQAPARVSIASQAYASPTKDRKTKYILAAFGVVVALGIGMAYGVVRELTDRQIRTRQDIARISELPTIASIPHLSEDRFLAGADSAMLMAQHPNSTVADEYRRILARILFPEDNAAEISSLLVVSASTEEGKTSVAANLAVALEQANRRVLLIDLSSQKPDIERKFGLTPSTGLSELLHNPHAREELIRSTAFENLGVVGPGKVPEELAGRLASREMMDFMEWADEHFDHIIVDTPPLLLMSDAKLLAPAMDGVLFVVGAGSSTLGMVSRCLSDLEQLRANIIGIVINGIRSMRGGYLRKNQSLYYAYTERAADAANAATDEMPEINVLDEDAPESVEAEVVLLPYDDDER